MNNTTNGTTKAVNVEVGKDIRLYKFGVEIFRGVIFNTEIASDGSFSFTAYDYNYYLTKNTDSMKFVKQKASQIIRTICKKFDIPYDHIDDTGYVIPKLILRNKSIYDMITIALTETRKKTGKVFMLGNESGKLVLRERKSQVKRVTIKDGSNLLSADYSESIEDLRNSVRLTGKNGEESKGVTVSDSDSIKKYGLMREKDHESEKTDAQLKPIANALLKELNKVAKESSVEAIGDRSIIAGKMVQVSEKMTGISGGFYVITDSHTFEPNGVHTMDITVSKTLELNEIEYEPPEEPAKTKQAEKYEVVDGKKIVGISYQTGWIATAYAPALGGINGSGTGLTASSTKVVEGRTIAVDPDVIPYGSVVAIYVPSKNEYSGLYLAEDTGGAIDGKKIDVAVVPSKARAFGVRNIQVAVLERGKGRADARSKAAKWSSIESKWKQKLAAGAESGSAAIDKAASVVKLARSFKGSIRYVFGSKNIAGGTGDCSGFTNYVYKKAIGKDIGQGTSAQIRKGSQVSKASAQAGDLVFFQGTYRSGVSHVGIVTRPGYCVSLASSGCKEHSYTSGYWGSHYMQIRRVL
ncbi:NlpC/P60 family protein [Peribacillus frigoritolerans]|uniref:XkdQ/YqbQ family protein n=1 Tax=Peribacillus frigoritolerans TaxID=450367 RepID=UPI002E219441|nr:NlpC/P60 family protein [Peribacillus frigoritolerans]MED3845517.1 NlpC/P60 family protein [Peribacillus frigoritolerans]